MSQENIEKIMDQNKNDAQVIKDHIKFIEQRLESEKGRLLEQLVEIEKKKYN